MNRRGQEGGWILFGVFAIIIVATIALFVGQMLKPWWAEMNGKAEYAQAEQNRRIKILEADAAMESAKLLAQAEVERAKGVSQANVIIGDSLKGNDAYLRYLWILGMQTNQMQVVYVPTEANLPILEADRFGQYAKT